MKTTQLTFNTDFDNLNANYIFFKFTSKDDNAWIKGKQLDKLLENHDILASVYRQGTQAYVIAKRTTVFDIEELRLKIKAQDNFSPITIHQVTANATPSEKSISDVDLYQLLFNATSNSQDERYQFNNLNGKLVLLPPFVKQSEVMTAFHLELNQGLVLIAKATTYQTKAYAKKSEKDKALLAKKLAKPAYRLHLTTFKRDFDSSDDTAYIQAGVPNKKTSESALKIKSHKDFLQSRLAILQTAIDRFNKLFERITNCHWSEKMSDETLRERFHMLNRKNAIAKLAKSLDIRLLDKIDSEESQILIEDIQTQLELMGISSTRDCKIFCVNRKIGQITQEYFYEQHHRKTIGRTIKRLPNA